MYNINSPQHSKTLQITLTFVVLFDTPGGAHSWRRGQNPHVAIGGPAQGHPLHPERHHCPVLAAVAALHRPAGPGQQVREELGEGERPGHNQAVRQGLPAQLGERDPLRQAVSAREHRHRAGSGAGAGAAAADFQAVGKFGDQAGRRDYSVP